MIERRIGILICKALLCLHSISSSAADPICADFLKADLPDGYFDINKLYQSAFFPGPPLKQLQY